jgi:hypothetical protein
MAPIDAFTHMAQVRLGRHTAVSFRAAKDIEDTAY